MALYKQLLMSKLPSLNNLMFRLKRKKDRLDSSLISKVQRLLLRSRLMPKSKLLKQNLMLKSNKFRPRLMKPRIKLPKFKKLPKLKSRLKSKRLRQK